MHAAVVRYELYQVMVLRCNLLLLTGSICSLIRVTCLQGAALATGLTTSTGTAITYEAAVDAIATLRNNLGGTSSSSVENNLFRTPTSYSSNVNTTSQPDLFGVDSNGVAFTRTPKQVKQQNQTGNRLAINIPDMLC